MKHAYETIDDWQHPYNNIRGVSNCLLWNRIRSEEFLSTYESFDLNIEAIFRFKIEVVEFEK